MAKAKKAAAPATKSPPKKSVAKWLWVEIEAGKRWLSSHIPEGDVCAARVQRTFSKGPDGKWGYYCYRSGELLAMRPTVEEAQARCEEGGGRAKREDNVLRYIDGHPLSVPAFLLLTPEERAAVRSTYPWAAPSVAKVTAAEAKVGRQSAANLSDPGTVKLLAELSAKMGVVVSEGAPVPAKMARAPREQRAVASMPPTGTLMRARDGNPKKEGSAAWKRWSLMFEHCERGSTVAEYSAAGGNMETLQNAILKGFAQIVDKQKEKK